jgi:hypothetical protein
MRLLILLSASLLTCSSSYADIVNGGFETGTLAGWLAGGTDGNVQLLKSGDFAASDNSTSIAAPFGTYYALLSNGPSDLGGPSLQTTTLTSIPYLVGAGASIGFVLNFFTNEFATPFGNPDFYTVNVLQGGVAVATITSGDVDGAQNAIPGIDCSAVFLVAPDNTTVCSNSGLQTIANFDLSGYAGTNVQFQFLVSNAIDNTFDSALLVDNVQGTGLTDASAVPEPQSWVLLGTVVLGIYAMSRWRRAAARG